MSEATLREALEQHEFKKFYLGAGCSCGWRTQLMSESDCWPAWAGHVASLATSAPQGVALDDSPMSSDWRKGYALAQSKYYHEGFEAGVRWKEARGAATQAAQGAGTVSEEQVRELACAADSFRVGSVGSVWLGKVSQVERLDKAVAVVNALLRQPPSAPAKETMELCGKVVTHLIAGASWYPCALPKGHDGDCRASGECFKHGRYLGEPHKPPQCPHWPECIPTPATPVIQPEAQVMERARKWIEPWTADGRGFITVHKEILAKSHAALVTRECNAARLAEIRFICQDINPEVLRIAGLAIFEKYGKASITFAERIAELERALAAKEQPK